MERNKNREIPVSPQVSVSRRQLKEALLERYTPEMYATLLLPAGVTSQASIRFKDEEKLLSGADNADDVYVEKVLPEKMKYNLESIRKFSFWREISTMFQTVFAVFFR